MRGAYDGPMHVSTQYPVSAANVPAAEQLAHACKALWLATLALMTAYMHNRAPAHRCLLARRIARNLHTLREQDCFSVDCRHRFERLACHWEAKAEGRGAEKPGFPAIAASLRNSLQSLL